MIVMAFLSVFVTNFIIPIDSSLTRDKLGIIFFAKKRHHYNAFLPPFHNDTLFNLWSKNISFIIVENNKTAKRPPAFDLSCGSRSVVGPASINHGTAFQWNYKE
jgi:hypothetical protein